MPFIGLGLHIVLALLCAIHVVRSGQQLYWLFILFAFPMLGSIVYLFAVYLPSSRLERGAFKAVSAATRALDPGKTVRLARSDFDETPTAQNQMRLAAALLDAGQAEEAATLYEGALKGPFATDADLLYGAARSFVACRRYQDALPHLEMLSTQHPNYRAEGVLLLMARCYAGASRDAQARAAFEQAVQRFGTYETYAEYAIWGLAKGDDALVARLQAEIDRMTRKWTSANRELNSEVMRRLRAARQDARR